MATLYKLTDAAGWTRFGKHNACLWGPGVTHTANGVDGLCSDGVIHAYRDPLVAVLLDPSHGRYLPTGRMWEAEGEVSHEDATKVGCRSLTTVREISLPEINNTQKVAFAILCAMQVRNGPKWADWAKAWLSGEDRSRDAALAAARTWAEAAAWAATAAARARSEVASWSATAAAAPYATVAAAATATSAAGAAWAALEDLPTIDLPALAQRAMEVK